MFLPLAAVIWVPVWARLRLLSVYEYLELRFHGSIRAFGALLFILTSVFWIGTALVTAALGFETVTGVDGRLCLVIMAVLGTASELLTYAGYISSGFWSSTANLSRRFVPGKRVSSWFSCSQRLRMAQVRCGDDWG